MKPADIGKRLVAYIIDSLVLGALTSILLVPFYCCMFIPLGLTSNTRTMSNPAELLLICGSAIILIALEIAITYAYAVWYPVTRQHGATLGKKAMHIRVVKADGKEVGQGTMLLREFIGKPISRVVFYFGYIWILIDEKGRGWHDMIADTLVVEAE